MHKAPGLFSLSISVPSSINLVFLPRTCLLVHQRVSLFTRRGATLGSSAVPTVIMKITTSLAHFYALLTLPVGGVFGVFFPLSLGDFLLVVPLWKES